MAKYFGTDGIRGMANAFPMTPEIAMKVGMATGLIFQEEEERPRIVIGKDTRLSGYMIEPALTAGFTAMGADVFLLGPIPTPAVAMLTRSMRADLGVMISASHNPFEDNGIKLFGKDGYKLSDDIQRQIEILIDQDLAPQLVAPRRLGRTKRVDGALDRYTEYAKRTLNRSVSLNGLRVVIDCAHGAAYRVAPLALWELGAEVFKIGADPDGFNINVSCGSTSPEALSSKVKEVRADIGIALDGDGDRVILSDETGKVIDGDQLMAVIAEDWKSEGILSKPGLVASVMSNLGFERHIKELDLELVRCPVGDRIVSERMRQDGYNLGGEQNGHIIMSDHCATGDGLVAALQILAVIKKQAKPASEICNRFDPVPQILRNVRVGNCNPLEADNVVKAIADGATKLGSAGRLVVRKSGTEPLVRVMAEGDNDNLITSIVDDICGELAKTSR